MHTRASKIILDPGNLSVTDVNRLTRQIGNRCYAVTVDHQHDLMGGNIVHELSQAGAQRVWVNVALHDKPEVAARRARALAKRGARIITVHASGGLDMMEEVVDAVAGDNGYSPAIYAVMPTVGSEEFSRIYGGYLSLTDVIFRLAPIVREAHVDGIVCRPEYVKILSAHPAFAGWIVADLTEKNCAMTPRQAIEEGADYIIIGHQVTGAEYPERAFDDIETAVCPHMG